LETILGTLRGADYPLNATPVRDLREVTRVAGPDVQNVIKGCEWTEDEQGQI